MRGSSHSIPRYLTVLALVSQYCPLYSVNVNTACGTRTVHSYPIVNLSAADAQSAVAASARRQGGQPWATESSCLESYATGRGHDPNI